MPASDVKVGSIFAEIRAKLDGYDKDLKEARKMTEQSMAGLQKSIDKISFDKAGSSVMDFAKKAAMAFAAWKIVDTVKDATMASARFETLGVTLERLTQNTSYSISEMKGFEEQLQKTGISMLESRQVLLMMIQANLDLGKSSELARVAQDAAIGANLNSSETLVRMTHAIAANSVEVMRTIGLEVNFELAVNRAAASMNKKVGELTEAQKIQARYNATIDAGAQVAGAYEAAFGTAGKQINSFVRYISNFQVEFGKAFNPALTAVVFGASEAMKVLTETVKDPKFQSDMTKFATEFSENLVNGMKWMVDNKEQVGGYFKGIATGLEAIARVFSMLPAEAWAAILGYKVAGLPGAATAAAAALIVRATEPDKRDTLFIVEEQVRRTEQLIAEEESLNALGEEAKEKQRQTLAFLNDQLDARKEGLAILVRQANLVHMLTNAEGALVDVIDNHNFNISGKTSPGYKAAFPAAKTNEELAKEKKLQTELEGFEKEYQKILMSEYDFEVWTLDEKLKKNKEFVTDKLKLAAWYSAEKKKIDIKEYAESNDIQSLKTSGVIRPEENEAKRFLQGPLQSRENAAKYQASQEDLRTQNEKDIAWAAEYQQKMLGDTKREMEIFTDTMNIMSQTAADAFAGFVMGTKSAKEAFQEMIQSMISGLVRLASQKMVEQLFGYIAGIAGSAIGGGGALGTGEGGGLYDPYGHAHGAAFGPAGRYAFAKGGVVSRPTLFNFAKGTGLMGEAGDEGILPLKRNSKGDLGVQAEGSGGGGGTNIAITINAVDSKSFADLAERNPGAILAPFMDAIRKGNSGVIGGIKTAAMR
jgi:hypothetical protein